MPHWIGSNPLTTGESANIVESLRHLPQALFFANSEIPLILSFLQFFLSRLTNLLCWFIMQLHSNFQKNSEIEFCKCVFLHFANTRLLSFPFLNLDRKSVV